MSCSEELEVKYSSRKMSIPYCVQLCKAADSNIALVRGENCSCTADISILEGMPSSSCSDECPGNPTQRCGSHMGGFTAADASEYDALADTCWDMFKLGIRPSNESCAEFKNAAGETYECCRNKINPSGGDEVIKCSLQCDSGKGRHLRL